MRFDRQLGAMAAYGFVSGLPLPLSGFTFRLWLSDSGAGLAVVGLTAWIGLAYSLKFLWAPLLDQVPPLAALRRFGRRRGWLLLVQPALGLAAVVLALSDPGTARAFPVGAFAAAACVALLSATQDIAIDAWRIEVFPPRRQGLALAVYVWGYRVALLVSTTGAIGLAASVGWHWTLLGVAVLAGSGCLVTLAARAEEPGAAVPSLGVRQAIVEPVRSFLARPLALLVLAFVALFKLGEAMAGIMTAPFYRHLTFDKAAIAATGPFSLGGTLVGITLGGWLVARIGVGRALLATGWAQTVAMGMYVLLSLAPGQHAVLYATVTTDELERKVTSVQNPGQVLPGNVQQIRSLRCGKLSVNGRDNNRVAAKENFG